MSSVINTNTASLAAQRNLLGAQNTLTASVERLSSGLRINRAKDDAAGLGVSEALQKQLNGIKQGIRNLNDGISMAQTAEGALSTVADMAQRIVTLATQGANETLNLTQRKSIQAEINALRDAINDVSNRTTYSGSPLFSGAAISLQVSNTSSDTVTISTTALASIKLETAANTARGGLFTDIGDLATAITAGVAAGITTAFTDLQTTASTYLDSITTQRGELGAFQNRLEYTVNNLSDFYNNLSAARSRVIDTDYAAETANLTKGQILQQAATAMLAQANQMPNVVLTLLK
jgi:flagellin